MKTIENPVMKHDVLNESSLGISLAKSKQQTDDTLCWSCKRSCNLPDCKCSWSDSFTPVAGWTAIQGRTYYLSNPENPNTKEKSHGYHVIDCPLYIRMTRFLDFKDIVKEVIGELGISQQKFYQKPLECIKVYEVKTGEQIPLWAKIESKKDKYD